MKRNSTQSESQNSPNQRRKGSKDIKREFVAAKAVNSVSRHLSGEGVDMTENSKDRLYRWLSREAKGSSEDLVSPFFGLSSKGKEDPSQKQRIREQVMGNYLDLIRKSGGDLPKEYLQVVFTREESQAERVGPQSCFTPWGNEDYHKVQEVFSSKTFSKKLNGRALHRAVERVQSILPLSSVGITSLDEAVGHENSGSMSEEGMDITTNSGLPFVKSPWKPRASQSALNRTESSEAFMYIMNTAENMLTEFRRGKSVPLWAIAGKRLTQTGPDWTKPKHKRLVIAIEKSEPVLWKTFTPQLLKMLSTKIQFCALNDLPAIDRGMQDILKQAEAGGRTVIGGDYSSYDQTLPPDLIRLAGLIVSRWVANGAWIIQLVESMVSRVRIVTPVGVYPSDSQLNSSGAFDSSMKSGSGGTNLLDSICNLICIYYGEEVGAWKVVNAAVQGDDFVLDAIGANPEAVAEIASHLNLDANPTKQEYTRGMLSFLQRQHFLGYLGGMASTTRTLGSLLSYENLATKPSEWNAYMDIIRARAQLENCAFSPYFTQLVDYVKSGDRYSLGGRMTPAELVATAGPAAHAMLSKMNWSKLNVKSAKDDDVGTLSRSAVTGYLRGEPIPAIGSEERFLYSYGQERVALAEAIRFGR